MARVAREPARRSPDPTQADAWLIAYADSFRQPSERHSGDVARGDRPLFRSRDQRRARVAVPSVVVGPGLQRGRLRGESRLLRRLGRRRCPRRPAPADGRRRAQPRVGREPVVQGVPGRRARLPHFRTVDPDADLSAVVRPRTLPLVTTFQGARRGPCTCGPPSRPTRSTSTTATPRCCWRRSRCCCATAVAGLGDPARRDRLPVEGRGLAVDQPARDTRSDRTAQVVARRDRSGLMIVTETNVPHAENVAYLGRPGRREAQAVYQFALPPLVLHSLSTGDPGALVDWAAGLDELPPGRTYLNFTSSHDGVGVRSGGRDAAAGGSRRSDRAVRTGRGSGEPAGACRTDRRGRTSWRRPGSR